MNNLALLSCLVTALIATGVSARPTRDHVIATAELQAADGSTRGHVVVRDTDRGLAIAIRAYGLPPGSHGIHLHAKGVCEPPTFASAGPHLNSSHALHGSLNPKGAHLGDLPNVEVSADGKARTKIAIAGRSTDMRSALFGPDGTSVVIHAEPDDYRTDPSGNSGARLACGVLQREH